MKRLIPFLLSILVLAGCSAAPAEKSSDQQITMTEAVAMLQHMGDKNITNIGGISGYRGEMEG